MKKILLGLCAAAALVAGVGAGPAEAVSARPAAISAVLRTRFQGNVCFYYGNSYTQRDAGGWARLHYQGSTSGCQYPSNGTSAMSPMMTTWVTIGVSHSPDNWNWTDGPIIGGAIPRSASSVYHGVGSTLTRVVDCVPGYWYTVHIYAKSYLGGSTSDEITNQQRIFQLCQ